MNLKYVVQSLKESQLIIKWLFNNILVNSKHKLKKYAVAKQNRTHILTLLFFSNMHAPFPRPNFDCDD